MGEPEKAESGSLASLGGIIPSLYYDLIARVAPGLVFLLSFDVIRNALSDHRDGATATLLLAFSYIIGLLLTPFFEIIIGPLWLLMRLKAVRRWLKLPEVDLRSGNDVIGLVRADYGATLGKMQAESVLCANVGSGLIILRFLPWETAVSPSGPVAMGLKSSVSFYLFVIFIIVAANYRYGMWVGRQAQVAKLMKLT